MSKVKRALLRIISVYQVLGGLMGIGLIFFVLLPKFRQHASGAPHEGLGYAILVLFFLLFCVSVIAGFLLWKLKSSGYFLTFVIQLLQVPYLMTNALVYMFCSGVMLTLYFVNSSIGFFFYLGGKFLFFFGNQLPNQRVGINVLALVVAIWVFRCWRQHSHIVDNRETC